MSQTTFPQLSCQYIREPLLEFAGGREHVDPKTGIARFGPKSLNPLKRHPASVRVGFIGTAETISSARTWLEKNTKGVLGSAKHLTFPGFMADRGYRSQLLFEDDWIAQLNRREMDEVLKITKSRDRFEEALLLLLNKLEVLSKKDRPPEYVIVALPDAFYQKCRVTNFSDPHLGKTHRDLRLAFKATAMKYRLPTQLLRQATAEGRKEDHPANIAWDFFNGLYTKAGGFAWGPRGLQPGTCYVGISFFHPLGTTRSTVQTSVAQAFDEYGQGLVLRGQDFTWDPDKEGTRAPHLTKEQAADLIAKVLKQYQDELGSSPKRVVLHKSSHYWPDEREGFEGILQAEVERYDLLTLSNQDTVRLFPESKYPPLRGTRIILGNMDFLYTEGFVPELNRFFNMGTPLPLKIADHIGFDTSRETLVKEILSLTKMNWNSTHLGGLFPITLEFSKRVGAILREMPADLDPLANFKFYM
jgi:hypothetical protein